MICIENEPEVDQKYLRGFQTNWLEKFKPTNVSDLTIHPKKLQEIRNWFELYERGKDEIMNKILLVIGQSGSAKTISTKLIAKELYNYDICEWITPIDIESDLFYDNESKFTSYESQVTKFQDFLFKSSRYGSLFSNKNRILLIKDIPNTFMKNKSEEFWDILRYNFITSSL